MKKTILLLMLLCVGKLLSAQFVYTIKADSVKITNDCDTAELIIENHTQDTLGFLYNKGKGRTEFRRVVKLNDSTLLFGEDTLVIRGVGEIVTASNGLSKSGGSIQLGQQPGAVGNPAQLTGYREIPLNGFGVNFTNSSTNKAITLQNSAVGITGDTASLTLTENSLQRYLVLKTNPDYSLISTKTPNMYLYPAGGLLINFDSVAPEDPGNQVMKIGGNLRVSGDFSYEENKGVLVESTTSLSNYSGGSVKVLPADIPTAANQRLGGYTFGFPEYPGGGRTSAHIVAFSENYFSEDPEGNYYCPSYMVFGTTPLDAVFPFERMRITASGNVGIGTTTPASLLHVGGSGRFDDSLQIAGYGIFNNTLTSTGRRVATNQTSSTTYLTETDEYVFANATSSAFNVVLPDAAEFEGQRYTIKKTDSGTNAVTVTTTFSQFIDGSSTYSLTTQWQFVTVVASGGNWLIVAKN